MSELHNYQSTEAWRNNLKKFLTMKRSTEQLKEKLSGESRPQVIDLDFDIKELMEKEKKNATINNLRKRDLGSQNNVCQKDWPQISDESFEALENMCNKTASDPNSTLFKYLHGDQKEKVLAKNKANNAKCAPVGSYADSQKLLDKLKDCTILDDIEAPSNFWENSVTSDNAVYTSPIKMVGLLRPSTIMEETMINDDADSNVGASSKNVEITEAIGGSDNCSSFFSSKPIHMLSYTNEGMDLNVGANICSANNSPNGEKVVSKSGYLTNQENSNSSLDTSVIEILSDDEGLYQDGHRDANAIEEHTWSTSGIIKATADYPQVEEITNDENDKENRLDVSSINCMQFNDTIEEVEYIMKKGMEYITLKQEEETKACKPFVKNQHHENMLPKTTLMRQPDQPTSLKRSVEKEKAPVTSQFKVPLDKRVVNSGLNLKPFPKFNLSVKSNKECKKKQFAHIVSPVGTYMKKTATTPLMMDMKPRKTNNLLTSSTFRKLEYESRVNTPTKVQTSGAALPLKIEGQKTLSKKAYISSELKHIVDERTPVTIPGGQKIQKYLENAVMPAVLKHEGKIKISNDPKCECLKSAKVPSVKNSASSNTPDNTSIANLSVMSGDLSLYTITDARKF